MKLNFFVLLIFFNSYCTSLTNLLDDSIEYHLTCTNRSVDNKLVIPTSTIQSNQIVKLNLSDVDCNKRLSVIKLFVYKSLSEYNKSNYISINIDGDYFYQVNKAKNSLGFMIKVIEHKSPVGGGE